MADTPAALTLEQANEEIAKLKDQVSRLGKALGELGGNVSQVNISTGKLGGAFSSLFDATAKGTTGLSAYNTTLDLTGKALTDIIGTSGPLAIALNGMSDAARVYVKMAGAQADALMKSYQDLSSVGAAGKADLTDVYTTMSKFGVTSREELPKFTQMLSQNSEMLAKMGGTVSQGMKQFADVSASIQQTGLQTEFMNMGMSVDSINKGIAGYLKIQTQAGASQKMTQEQLNVGAAEYIRNMDVLSKLTGKSAEALGKEREERMNDEKYMLMRRQQEQVAARGGAEGERMAATIKQQDELLSVIKAQYGDETAKAAMRAMGPNGAQSEEGLKLLRSLPETYKIIADMNKGGKASNEEIAAVMAKESSKYLNNTSGLVQAGGTTGGLNSVELIRGENARAAQAKANAEAVAAGGKSKTATQTAKDQQTAQTETPDSSVAAMTALVQQQRQATKAVSDMTVEGIKPATEMMQYLANKAREFAQMLPGAKELSQRQKDEQAAYKQQGKPEEGGGVKSGFNVGQNTSKMRTGITPATIEEAAIAQEKAVQDQLKKSKEKVEALGGEVVTAFKEMLAKLIRPTPDNQPQNNQQSLSAEERRRAAADALRRQQQQQTNQPADTTRPPRPRSFSGPEGAQGGLTIDRGYVNIASAENITFPQMPTAYQSSLDPDMMSKLSALSTATGNTSSEQQSTTQRADSELIASNALVSQKLDDLIDLMRKGVGYQRKISMSASA